MNVLVKGRVDSKKKIGGDILSFVDRIPYLEKLGVSIEIDYEGIKSSKNYDIVHLQQSFFNSYDIFSHLEEAKYYNKPIILKPLYNSIKDTEYYMRFGQSKTISLLYKTLNNHNLYVKIKDLFYLK